MLEMKYRRTRLQRLGHIYGRMSGHPHRGVRELCGMRLTKACAGVRPASKAHSNEAYLTSCFDGDGRFLSQANASWHDCAAVPWRHRYDTMKLCNGDEPGVCRVLWARVKAAMALRNNNGGGIFEEITSPLCDLATRYSWRRSIVLTRESGGALAAHES